MKNYNVTGGGDVQIHVAEAGNPEGQPLLFIHGVSQCRLAWKRQFESDLTDDYRLVAMDLRGHGLSEKPIEGYGDSKLWADDVNAVIEGLDLTRPVIAGWSYGPLVIFDYIRHYGEENIGGINIVGGITKLGTEEAASVLTPEFLALVPGFFSTDADEAKCALESLLKICFAKELSEDDLSFMLDYNVAVPAYVRKGMFTRSFDNDDLLPKISKPVLITHGTLDSVVLPAVVDQHSFGMPHAEVHMIEDAGHAPFWEDTSTYNQRLRAFASSLL